MDTSDRAPAAGPEPAGLVPAVAVDAPATGPDLAVALDALEYDAARWVEAAVRLRTAASAAAELALEPAAFSFAGGGVAAVYEELRRRTATLLREGADNLDAVAVTLRATATSYAAAEAAAAQGLVAAAGAPR